MTTTAGYYTKWEGKGYLALMRGDRPMFWAVHPIKWWDDQELCRVRNNKYFLPGLDCMEFA